MATAEILLNLAGPGADATNPPGILYRGVCPYLVFDGTTDELLTRSFRLPSNYSSGITLIVQYSMVSATTGVVAIRTECMAVSQGENITADSFDTLEKSSDSTVPGTAGLMKEISFSLTNVDGLVAGDNFTIKFGRENGTTGTNAAGDMAVWAVSLSYTTT
jgi:hypothetical protein